MTVTSRKEENALSRSIRKTTEPLKSSLTGCSLMTSGAKMTRVHITTTKNVGGRHVMRSPTLRRHIRRSDAGSPTRIQERLLRNETPIIRYRHYSCNDSYRIRMSCNCWFDVSLWKVKDNRTIC